jgi:hypothetical protein
VRVAAVSRDAERHVLSLLGYPEGPGAVGRGTRERAEYVYQFLACRGRRGELRDLAGGDVEVRGGVPVARRGDLPRGFLRGQPEVGQELVGLQPTEHHGAYGAHHDQEDGDHRDEAG